MEVVSDMIEAALLIGTWCWTSSLVNGWDNLNKVYVPRIDVYERKIDCDPDMQVTFGRRGLKDYRYHSATLNEDGTLEIEGGLWKKKKRSRR